MAYSRFTLSQLKQDFDIILDETQNLFAQVSPRPVSELLTLTLQDSLTLATRVNTEKVRSELLIVPILMEVRRQLRNQIS